MSTADPVICATEHAVTEQFGGTNENEKRELIVASQTDINFKYLLKVSNQVVIIVFQKMYSLCSLFVKAGTTIITTTSKQRRPGGTGGSEKLDSSNQPRHTQGQEKR